ncbi:Do family serine endopeptidase [Marinospirillum alkaliphilum]|uniref:Serine protease DegS n=1 Tax=Marinospirillum alkaliphilum DSM 21637 TaxID=1122209 RepID=A0A1K1TPN5_9GAMM|nr:Do family serine endopeptidase [Marinospirillum alkaliphilum]SFX02494.1 serine protease DegS [Marinospirillum alkaliphilum DSM 21637]
MRFLKPQLVWPVISGLLLAALLLQTFPGLSGQQGASNNVRAEIRTSEPILVPRQDGPVSYAGAVRQAAPSVVNIYTTKVVEQQINPLMNDPFFRHFFGPGGQPRQQRMQSSLGSGVIVSSEGYILTNHHVVSGADEIRVALRDGRETFARIIGSDPDSDLAVLRIELDNLPAIALASSDTLEVGDVVLAIGNPFGVGQTVTQGIVSALGRNSLGINTFEDFIQTDAAINPGNSGGALINPYGQLLGINTAIFSRSGGSQGIGFAIPSNLARQIMVDLINEGFVVRGWLGIEVQEMTPALAQSLRLDSPRGVLVAGLLRNGPAHNAGLQPGDVIVAINGQRVSGARETINFIASLRPETQITLEVVREGRSRNLTATIGQRPSSPRRG